jgi:hypothetical protein
MISVTWLIGLLSVAVAGAEETSEVEAAPAPKRATVLYADEAPEVVQQHVSVVSGAPVGNVKAILLSSFLRGQSVSATGDASLKTCKGSPSTMKNVKEAIDRSRGAIDLLEDNKAMAYLTTAVGGIGCLGEALNGEQASELYFLKGFLEHAGGDEEAAKASFQLVHQMQSGLGWDNYFSPEAEPLFNEAAADVSAAEMVTVNIIPTPDAGSVWLNGNPATVVGSQVQVPVGHHILQFVADKVTTYELDLNAAGEVGLLIPGLLASSTMDWVASEELSKNYSAVFSSAFDEGMVLYASYEGSIWSTTIGSGDWTELVAQGAADQAEILKAEAYAKSPKTTGIAFLSVAGGLVVTGLGTGVGSLVNFVEFSKNDKINKKMPLRDTKEQQDRVDDKEDNVTPYAKKAASLGIVSAITTAAGGVSLGFAFSNFKKAKLRRAELPPWHPYSVDLMEEEAAE